MEQTKENKPIHVKPSLYAYYFLELKEIALKYGYNLVLHGSLNRDLDLIAIPWQTEIGNCELMIKKFADVIGGKIENRDTETGIKKYILKPHGRKAYTININRELIKMKKGYKDSEYYLDVSVVPPFLNVL